MNNQLVQTNYNKVIGTNIGTGLNVVQSFLAQSGFNYQLGVRNSHGLLIVEGIAEGIGCTYLCGVKVLAKDTNQVICEIPVSRNVHYSREEVMKLVAQHLSKAVADAATREGQIINMNDIHRQVDEILDDCYFAESRKAALNWAEQVGIIKS